MTKNNTEFFQEFITDFYDGIEEDIAKIFKRDKLKKINAGQYKIDAIDYKGNSETPILETIKYMPEEGLTFYFHNEKMAPEAYASEEIFHPFSLAVLVDRIVGKEKYSKILQEFYEEAEKRTAEFLKNQPEERFGIEGEEYEIMGIGFENEKYKFIEGCCCELKLKDGRVYLATEEDDIHIAGTNASDISFILNEILK